MVGKVLPKEVKGDEGSGEVKVETPEPPSFFVSRVTGERFTSEVDLLAHYSRCRVVEDNQAIVNLEFQGYIPAPPVSKDNLRQTFASNDDLTVRSWWEEWKANKVQNLKEFDISQTAMSEHGKWAYKPIIISGTGPSLKRNARHLAGRGGIGLVSCLHSFGFFHDLGVRPDYYLNLDAGDITLPEMAQGGSKGEDYYWEASKDYTLVTALHCNPKLHRKWKGKILWFDTALNGMNESIPDPRLEEFRLVFQTGGNTLGACHYMAKAVLGGSPIIFVGADFSFSYERKFHPFGSPYDQKFAGVIPVTDIYGNRVATWPSYYGFKAWFEHIAMGGQGNTPGTYINCTEGGILGAYADGNIAQIKQARLETVLQEYDLHKKMPELMADKTRRWVAY